MFCHGSSSIRPPDADYGRQAVGIVHSHILYVTVAQLAERGTHKPEVAGSIPARDTIFLKDALCKDCTSAQCPQSLPKVGAAHCETSILCGVPG